MVAEITWNGPAVTYRAGSQEFKLNTVVTVADAGLIAYCKATKGFNVRVIEESQPPRPVRDEPVASEPVEEKPAEDKTAEPKSESRRSRRGRRTE